MFLSMQSLNGDSYQGAQVGANVQSQVGPTIRDSSWLNPCRELSLSCLCTEPSTVQSEAQPKIENKKSALLMRGQFKFQPCIASHWQTVLTLSLWMEYFGSQNIIPPHFSKLRVTAPNLLRFCDCIWLWLELLGWYWVFGTVFPPFFCISILLSSCYCVLLMSSIS